MEKQKKTKKEVAVDVVFGLAVGVGVGLIAYALFGKDKEEK